MNWYFIIFTMLVSVFKVDAMNINSLLTISKIAESCIFFGESSILIPKDSLLLNRENHQLSECRKAVSSCNICNLTATGYCALGHPISGSVCLIAGCCVGFACRDNTLPLKPFNEDSLNPRRDAINRN